jgi:hypothetical protein
MENTANSNITTENTTPETTVETGENKTPVQTQEPVKTYTQEEYDKAIQSASSKAKNEILKALEIKSVDEFKTLKETYDKAVKDSEELKTSNEKLNHLLVLKDLNVKDDSAEDFIDLAIKRISDKVDFKAAAEEVAKLYPAMLKGVETNIKTGIEKKDGSKSENQYSEDMLKRYPWLKNNKKI